MKVVEFSQIKKELVNNMRRKMLIPVIGSGFTRGCIANKGKVPSGKDYRDYMVGEIIQNLVLTQIETDRLKSESFSQVSEIYHEVISPSEQKAYLKSCFINVKIEEYKKKMLQIGWPYVYTLNIDDGIENNSCYNYVICSNRNEEVGIFDDFKCVIKLHGDVAEMLAYKDTKSEVCTQKQYLDSLKNNRSLLNKLSHDAIYQNLIFIGCSLDDEIDLIDSLNRDNVATARYICLTQKPSSLEEIKYAKYGITHCIIFDSYEKIYENIYDVGVEAEKIHIDDLEKFKSFRIDHLPTDYESNKPYLFFGKSLINKDHTISLPYFFISRSITEKLFNYLFHHPLQFLIGSACSGKSYVLVDLACRMKKKDVYLFETKNRLTNQAFDTLVRKDNCLILADDKAFSEEQIEYFITNQKRLEDRNINVIIAVDKHNREINGILKLHELQGTIAIKDIPLTPISNKLNNDENQKISSRLAAVTAGIFKKNDTIVDNIIQLSKELSEKNKYHNVVPRFDTVEKIAALIALATERKIYSKRAVDMELYDELLLQYKSTTPLIDREPTWSFESSFGDNSSVKYVVNAEYWLCYQLEEFARKDTNYKLIVDAYKYIVTRIVMQEGVPSLLYGNKNNSYREYILFDNINRIFCSTRFSGSNGLALIREIYEGLNELLSADPHYMHQRAKCYIKSARFEKEIDGKIEYFDKAYRDANVALQVFENRYNEFGNEKILISAAHVKYTKALILCHRCNIQHFKNIEENTSAIHMLYNALSSPYNSYEFAREDSFNYENVISKIVCETVANKTLVTPEVYLELTDLFKIISA